MQVHFTQTATANQDDIVPIAKLLGDVFGGDKNWEAAVRWQYLENPQGKAIYINAFDDDGRLVCHYAVVPALPFANSKFKEISTYLSLNTAVHPDAQGKGLFQTSAKLVYEYLDAKGPNVVLGIANENSVNGFVKRLGFLLLGQLRLDALFPFQSPKPSQTRLLEMNTGWLEWRLSRPEANYRKLRGSALPVFKNSFMGLPVNCLLSTEELDGFPATIRSQSIFAQWFAPTIYASYGLSHHFALHVPDTLRPSPLHFIVRPSISGPALDLLNHLQRRSFEFLDFDVV